MKIHIVVGDSNEKIHINQENVFSYQSDGDVDTKICEIINNLDNNDTHIIMKDSSICWGKLTNAIEYGIKLINSQEHIGVCMMCSSRVDSNREVPIVKHLSSVRDFSCSQAFIITQEFISSINKPIINLFEDVSSLCHDNNLKITRVRPNLINYDESKITTDNEAIQKCNIYMSDSMKKANRSSLVFKFAVIIVVVIVGAWAAYQVRKRIDTIDTNRSTGDERKTKSD